MQHKVVLPYDVLASVVDTLGTKEDKPDIATLRNLSQTCKSLVPLCRGHLFSSLNLWSSYTETAERFSNLLLSNSDIVVYLKVFQCEFGRRGVSEHEEHIFRVLYEKSPSLRSIHLEFVDRVYAERFDWDSLRGQTTRLYLESLISLPTITSINLHSIRNFPFSLLSMCSSLNDIQLKQVSSASSYEVQNTHTRTKIPAPLYVDATEDSCGALASLISRPSVEEPILDFSHLKEVALEISSSTDFDITKEILKSSICLDTLELTLNKSFSLESMDACFVANRNTFQSMKLIFQFGNSGEHPLCGLNHLLRTLSGDSDTASMLKQLDLTICLGLDTRCNTSSRDWDDFDAVLTRPGAFPRLKEVMISLFWESMLDGVRDYELDEVLGQLTEDRFSGLSQAESISFYVYEEHEWV